MIKFVESLDGHATRSGDFVNGLFGMPTCRFKQRNGSLHGLEGNLLSLLRIEPHLTTAFHLGTDVAHHVGNTARCHHHAWTDKILAHHKRVAIDSIKVFHRFQVLVSYTRRLGNETHAGTKLCRNVGNNIEELTFLTQLLSQHTCGEVGSIRHDDLLLKVKHMLHLCQHHLHEPGFHNEHYYVGILHCLHIVGCDVKCRVFLLELGKKCLILVCNGDIVNLSTFRPPFDERAAHIASANDSKFHFSCVRFD